MTLTATVARTDPSTIPHSRARTGLEVCITRTAGSGAGTGCVAEADAVWPRRVRRIVRAGLRHWGRPDLTESAELLATELVTNALKHGRGPDVGVRLYLTAGDLVIEVLDGSPQLPVPRNASPEDEDGRGLFLVNAIADAWGASQDGTTTWCSLSLCKGPVDMEPVAATSPVSRECSFDLPGNVSAVNVARVKARSYLTVLGWRGNVHGATDVISRLVDNAVRHGLIPGDAEQPLRLRLAVTESHELVVDVEDPIPQFPDFGTAIEGEQGRGLWEAKRLGAQITWFLRQDAVGKTVRATLTPGPVKP